MKRARTGIPGVDDMLKGGVPVDAIIGLQGPPGVGKSIFSLHFLLEGARKGEKCVYINLEEPRSNIQHMIDEFTFGDEFNSFVKREKIVIMCYSYEEYERIQTDLLEKIQEEAVNRVVIDSFNIFFTSLLGGKTTTDHPVRKSINKSFSLLRKPGLTSLLVLEKMRGDDSAFAFNIPFLVDGIISLDYLEMGAIERRVFIPKMRWTDQYRESRPFDISKRGIVISDHEIEL